MSDNVFLDKQPKPENRALARALGKTFNLWVEIRDSVGTEHGPVVEEWKYYGAKYGWALKTLRQKRNLFFFTPCQGYFRISFAFGGKAVAAIETSGLPAAMIAEIKNAKKYAEGRGLRIEVRAKSDAEHVKKLIAIKVMN